MVRCPGTGGEESLDEVEPGTVRGGEGEFEAVRGLLRDPGSGWRVESIFPVSVSSGGTAYSPFSLARLPVFRINEMDRSTHEAGDAHKDIVDPSDWSSSGA
jgi:hypothetical protein